MKALKSILFFILLMHFTGASAQDTSINKLRGLHKEYNRRAASDTAAVNYLLKIAQWHLNVMYKKAFIQSKDSVLFYGNKAVSISRNNNFKIQEGHLYILLSRYFYEIYDDSSSKRYAELALELFKNQRNSVGIAEANLLFNGVYNNKAELVEADYIKRVSEAREIFKKKGDKIKEGRALGVLGSQYRILGDMATCIAYQKEAISLYYAANYKESNFYWLLISLTGLMQRTGDIDQAFSYAFEAVNQMEKYNPDCEASGECYNVLAKLYNYKKDKKNCLKYLEKAYSRTELNNDTGAYISICGNLAQVLIDLKRHKEALFYLKKLERIKTLDSNDQMILTGRLINVYTDLKEYKKAENYIGKAVALVENPAGSYVYGSIQGALAKYYFMTGQYKPAREYLNKYKSMDERFQTKSGMEFIHAYLFKIDSAEGSFSAALKNLALSQSYKDSIFDHESQKNIEELKIKYDVEKKERDLLLEQKNNKLLAQRNELQQKKLSLSNLTRNVSIAGTGVTFLILFLLYNRHRTNKKTNMLLRAQQDEILGANKALNQLVSEKEWLLKEIHHRVKNNLHMIMSLLNSQSYFLEDQAAISAIQNSQHRIQSMSLIHQKLYMADNLGAIRMQEYVTDLVEYLSDSFSDKKDVKFDLSIDDVEMDVSQAVPIGLILNEAITNSFKYAFAEKGGRIGISLKRTSENSFCMEIKDNGSGLPEDFDISQSKSLGMKLIKGLTRDLDGKLELASSFEGTRIKIDFLHKNLQSGNSKI